MFTSTEILTMIVYLIGLPLVRVALRATRLPGQRMFLLAYVAALGANVATVIEGAALSALMDSLEHLLTFTAACLFCVGCVRARTASEAEHRREPAP